jgi:LysR family transcriptional regulator, low CO2-responsive transcriptional regulator
MISLNQLEIFAAVVDCGGFSGAAKRLFMSQPSVSSHIRALENSLGVQLVQRNTRGARATYAGEVVLQHARELLAVLDSLDSQLAQLQGLKTGRLAVAGTTTLGTYLLPRLVADFAIRVPGVECQIRVGNEDAVEAWVLDNEVALALCAEEPKDERLSTTPMFDEQLCLIAPGQSPLQTERLTPRDLTDQRFILREVGSATRRQQESALAAWGLRQVERWEMWGLATLKESVCAGLGLSLISEHAISREYASGALAVLNIDPAPQRRTVSLVTRVGRTLTPPERAFVDLIGALAKWPELDNGVH